MMPLCRPRLAEHPRIGYRAVSDVDQWSVGR
jgi:hypothetical protein